MFERLSIFPHSKFLCKWFFTNLRGGLKLSLSKGTSADVKRDQGLMFLRELKQSGMPEDLLNVRLESSGYVTSGVNDFVIQLSPWKNRRQPMLPSSPCL